MKILGKVIEKIENDYSISLIYKYKDIDPSLLCGLTIIWKNCPSCGKKVDHQEKEYICKDCNLKF